jgi:hypothetical protein
MKKRTSRAARHGPEFRGVVKRISGKLTNRPDLEQKGREEMLGKKARPGKAGQRASRPRLNPDPHRRG